MSTTPGQAVTLIARAGPAATAAPSSSLRPRRSFVRTERRAKVFTGGKEPVGNFKDDYLYFDDAQALEPPKKKAAKSKANKTSKQPTPAFQQSKSASTDPEPTNNTLAAGTGTQELFCVCRMPDDGVRPMIQCDSCSDWFHFDCVGIDPVAILVSFHF